MLPIKNIVVKNMRKIALIMVVMILFFSTVLQIFNMQQNGRKNALQIFEQIEQILDENSKELEQIRAEYHSMCLNDARVVAYILEHNPEAKYDIEELKKIATYVEVDEIHIFNKEGVIVSGTQPEYYNYSFDSGEQMAFFKPLLSDPTLELVQDITPNTAEKKLVQYSALWSEDREFIVQVGMYPSTVLRATEKNELSYIFSLLRTGVGYSLHAIDPDTEEIVGSTVLSDVNKNLSKIGFSMEQLESDHAFYIRKGQNSFYCLSKKIGGNYILWTMPVSDFYHSVLYNNLLLLAGLVFISVILIHAVSNSVYRTVNSLLQNSEKPD